MAFDGPIGPATKDNSLPVTIATDQPAIDVSISSSSLPTGAATEAKQDVGNTSLSSIDGKIVTVNTGAVVISSSALPSGASTSALQTTGNSSLSSIDGKVPSGLTVTSTRLLTDGSGVTQPISVATLPLPTGAATSALQTQPGVDIGDVTINNAAGVSAVNIQDGGNSLTVDGSVTANAGTNLNTSALNLETTQAAMSAKLPTSLGAKTIANSLAVNIASDQTVPVSEINGVISTANSSTTPLGIAGTFTGTSEETTQYLGIAVAVGTDRNGTLNIDYSTDNSNWDQTQTYTITVASPGSVSGFFFQFMSEAKYYRLRYVNGGTAQGVFRLQSILKTNAGTGEVQYIQQPIIASTDALVTKGVIYGVTTGGGGGYVAVKVTPSGAITNALGDISGIVGQNTMANSVPVTIASNQTAVPISAASLPLPSGAATSALQTQPGVDIGDVTINNTAGASAVNIQDGGNSITVDGTVTVNAGTNLNTSALALETTQIANGVLTGAVTEASPVTDTASSGLNGRLQRIAQRITSLIALLPTSLGQKTMANSLAIVLSSDQSTIPTKEVRPTTSSVTSVASSATNVTLLTSNANRIQATFYNDSTKVLYLKFGATATTSSFTVQMTSGSFFELPFPCYTGIIDGIWSSANGNCRITEVTA
jgi:hypothetical protein